MMPRDLLDRAKEMARERTGIPTDRMLIAATHTHSAPAAMGALGCPADPAYVAFLPERIAESIARAAANLVPARIGWGVIDDDRHTFCRRWIRRPDRMLDDPFGHRTVRANMHPGHVNPDAIAPAGPVDPALTILAIQTSEGRPIAVLANYSQHYFGASPVSADYYGRFATAFARRIGADQGSRPFVGIMSQGTSGDQMWMDYARPRNDPGIERYANEVADSAFQAYKTIATYHDRVPLAMAETTLALHRRVPDDDRLRWARATVARMGDRPPRDLPEVYAKEAMALHQNPDRELKLQAVRIGGLGITAIPNEVFALTGLKIKARSPLPLTMNIELANGSEGYIPPPEQHALGGYTTWPARTAALEVQAEPTIVATVLRLLEQVADRPRRSIVPSKTPYAQHVLATRPLAYWRLDEMEGSRAFDATGHEHEMRFENGIAFYLPGPDLPGLRDGGRHQPRRSPGGRPACGRADRARRNPTPSSSGSGTACRMTRGRLLATSSPGPRMGRRPRPSALGGSIRSRGAAFPVQGRVGPARLGQDRDYPENLASPRAYPQRRAVRRSSRRQLGSGNRRRPPARRENRPQRLDHRRSKRP